MDLACAQLCVPNLSIQGRGMAGSEAALGEVLPSAIAAVLSEKLGVPEDIIAGEIKQGTPSKLSGLKERLLQRVIGQDEAVDRVYKRLLLVHAALGVRRGPLGVFLFLGPSGVGKTELARALAEALFGAENNLIRLDMSEYMEQHSVARLIGSPPGYIGHDEEGQLTGKLRTTPYAIILLDEVEKAHPRVFDTFLQVFDEGRITDAKGRTVDAKNAIFIMTSNILPPTSDASHLLGFHAAEEKEAEAHPDSILAELKKHFRTEFINRIDDVVVFTTLTKESVTLIARKHLDVVAKAVEDKYGKSLLYDDQVLDHIVALGYSNDFGVRNLHRVIQEQVELPISQLLASAQPHQHKHIRCIVKAGQIVLDCESNAVFQ